VAPIRYANFQWSKPKPTGPVVERASGLLRRSAPRNDDQFRSFALAGLDLAIHGIDVIYVVI
jgi:hypothetical protein